MSTELFIAYPAVFVLCVSTLMLKAAPKKAIALTLGIFMVPMIFCGITELASSNEQMKKMLIPMTMVAGIVFMLYFAVKTVLSIEKQRQTKKQAQEPAQSGKEGKDD